ncbi:hypothetical protein CEUSTIGMA_g12886.t1 [Chlamydomonas eustigma]|uniref:UTP23 sensor motif region domain-containing protein n=1 Tax=Chlamydomonas eustigma TaxID=1157962 RepID=A0A250XRN7_9CHLO|nr:hypothetical protein CEUSTIGMA_g12886.t1 [Chlamydomonas eustigma]|eukprot:GAX85470.1 hypothetical protein CEUSTIGMA_g12886.t1 [Chlamydomonas eustigma]
MRQKKHKKTARAVAFYKVNYNLHEPFKVLLDGNFIHATVSSNLANLDKHLATLLGGRCKPFVTPCIMQELRSLGPEFKDTVKVAKNLQLHYCGHGKMGVPPMGMDSSTNLSRQDNASCEKEDGDHAHQSIQNAASTVHKPGCGTQLENTSEDKNKASSTLQSADYAHQGNTDVIVQRRLPVSDCIRGQVGKKNPQHWWVATQDKALREELEKVPGAPIIYATINGIHLDTPSEMTKRTAKDAEVANSSLPTHERESEVLKDLELIRPKLTTNVKYRRNRAKGPNPLASKKKVQKEAQVLSRKALDPGSLSQQSKVKRKRKRKASSEAPLAA